MVPEVTATQVQAHGADSTHGNNTKAITPAGTTAQPANGSANTENPNQGVGEAIMYHAQAIVCNNKGTSGKETGKTFAAQDKLPKLPIPKLEDTCRRYLHSLQPLQEPDDHEQTKKVVEEFLKNEGPRLHKNLEEYAASRTSYISEFWDESYLQASESVVLNLNPFFILEDDPTPSRGNQLMRTTNLILASLAFIHDMRNGVLEPDRVRGTPLDMYQYTRLFGTARIPTAQGCRMVSAVESRHIVVFRRGQMYWFDTLDAKHRPLLSERALFANLQAICNDADNVDSHEVAAASLGVLSTENRRVWSAHRNTLHSDQHNSKCLQVLDTALFVVCMDDSEPSSSAELCNNMLCGTYQLSNRVQVGTCTNRWYDKLQIIVCANGAAGINFEHTGVDGHTVLRFVADIYTELIMRFAKSINSATKSLFQAKTSPYARGIGSKAKSIPEEEDEEEYEEEYDTEPKKLEWNLTPPIKAAIRFAESRLSDLICQNECQVLEFDRYGKNFITRHKFSPDAFVQMAFQAAYYTLYGRFETTYEPAMTKAFLHGRTEAIRTVQPVSVDFCKAFVSDKAEVQEKINALRKACDAHAKLSKACASGQGHDRHLYAMLALFKKQQQMEKDSKSGNGNSRSSSCCTANGSGESTPAIFEDAGYTTLNHTVLSTSNCGNPALRLFGFGPVAPDGFGLGYIIKDDAISICASSKHLQTKRFLDTLREYFLEIQRMIISVYKAANTRAVETYIDHFGVECDVRTGLPIGSKRPSTAGASACAGATANGYPDDWDVWEKQGGGVSGYSFFDAGSAAEVQKHRRKRSTGSRAFNVGRKLVYNEYS
ncbi:hypothetical protein K437DRAFT_253229 [Tilletiaria anomala UBC 951]|uniref:Choline/carnitine acyltransferase domain-containing protein n=1 Tax=Tilletiaria anomala (strain ATCC 24038 / CBS 436.72 / UBC 951) TaxID=1037660 RepID=A0A066WQC8_TILAU|nr:uncharacterized protein K437DRAFT_253229 [Tilletiaria anomala UBC 951]KDN53214.1 hypothetical protein K437DRAFT_253229 [Tilletiaria anomala UBC 951]